MIYNLSMVLRILMAFCVIGPTAYALAYEEVFSCPLGSRGSCLSYGEQICSSYGKCVDSSAVCFSAFTCDHKGFLCKSEYDDLVDDYNRLGSKRKVLENSYNDLVYTHNQLRDSYERLQSDYNELVDSHNQVLRNYNDLVSVYERLVADHSQLGYCIDRSSTVREAQACNW